MTDSKTNPTEPLMHRVLNQMALGAYRMLILLIYILIGVCFIGLLYLIFKSGIVPTIDFKTAKQSGNLIKNIPEIWM